MIDNSKWFLSVSLALISLSCINNRQEPANVSGLESSKKDAARRYYIEHKRYLTISKLYNLNPERTTEEWAKIWWEDFISNETLLAAIQGSSPGNADLHIWLKKEIAERASVLPRFVSSAEVTKKIYREIY